MRTVFNKDNMPKIGIRPTIDGRLGGVRESLEDQTMNQAKATAAFICRMPSRRNCSRSHPWAEQSSSLDAQERPFALGPAAY